ncbi:unnamed protein product [Sphagnum balticum]
MIFGQALAAFMTSSIPKGYLLLNEVTSVGANSKVIEALPVPGGFFFLINGSKEEVTAAYRKALELKGKPFLEIINLALIETVHPEILPGVFSQLQVAVADGLICASFADPVEALKEAQALLSSSSHHLIDLRLFVKEPHFFVTGGEAGLVESTDQFKSVTTGDWELITNPTPEFLSFFNLSSTKQL